MKKIAIIFIALIGGAVLQSCNKDFAQLEQNQNKPNQVPASLVLNGILTDMYQTRDGGGSVVINYAPWSLEHRQNQYWCCNYNYYGTNEYWSNSSLTYITLKNIVKMEEEAKRAGAADVNPYAALGKFFRAYFYVRMSQRVGDVPMTQAVKGLEIPTPAYDNQKLIYISVLNWLEEANTDLGQLIASNNVTLAGDFFYGNDLLKWRKAVNSFKLRVLISLSKKENDADLGVKAKFAAVLADPAKYPIMTSNSDAMAFVYNGTTNLYPINPGNRGFDKNRYNMAGTYMNLLTSLQDPRVFVVANPAKKKIADGVPANSFAAYTGAPSGESLDDMTTNAQKGEYSYANQKRYYTTFSGPEPGVLMGFIEQSFNIAEAIHRGWAPGSAAAYYNQGIVASMTFYGIGEGTVIPIYESDNDSQIGSYTASLVTYLSQPSVIYAGANATGLNQILQQKYLGFFQSSGLEAYFNYRRTGMPVFHAGPGTGNGGVIPKRWLYPLAEKTNNGANYSAALMSQFGTPTESVNTDLWIEKP